MCKIQNPNNDDDAPLLVSLLDILEGDRLQVEALGDDAVGLHRLVDGHHIHLALYNQNFLYQFNAP